MWFTTSPTPKRLPQEQKHLQDLGGSRRPGSAPASKPASALLAFFYGPKALHLGNLSGKRIVRLFGAQRGLNPECANDS